MTLQRQVAFWIGALIALIFFLWLLSPILLPFIAGLVLAYFLDPVADALERLGLSRLLATLAILIFSIVGITLLIILIAPTVADQAGKFAHDLPALIASLVQRFDQMAPQWAKDAVSQSDTNLQNSLTEFASKAAGWILTLLSSILTGGLALLNIVSLMIVTPIVAFYMLADWDRMVAKVDSWLPREYAGQIRMIASDIDAALAGFIRGQGTVCLLLGSFYAVGLSFAGLKYGLAVGLLAGFLSFIPYLGATTGAILAIGIALVQFWPDWSSILLVAGIFAVGQFIEGNFLSPKLVGGSVGLHPVWLMFALFAFGYIFGFVGLLLAVPMAAAAGVLVRFALKQYLHSKLYLGTSGDMVDITPVPLPSRPPQRKVRRSK